MSVNVTIVQPKPITVGVTTGDGFTLDITRPTYYIHAAAHHSGNNDELNHNLLGGLQGGSGNQYYHLTSGQYSKLNNIVYNTGNQTISGIKTFSDSISTNIINGINNELYINATSYLNIGDSSVINTFGAFASINTIGDFASENNFGNNAQNISYFGQYSVNNSFGYGVVVANTFGTDSSVNYIGHNSLSNYFGNSQGNGYEDSKTTNNEFGCMPRPHDGSQIYNIFGYNADYNYFGQYSVDNRYYSGNAYGQFNFDTIPKVGTAQIVLTTGNQNISGTKNFYIRPTVNGSGVLLDGESLSISVAQGISGTLQGQITTLNNQTGNYALKTETGNFITSSQTGQFYPNSNPSGYLNSSLTSKTIYVDAVGTDSRGVSSKYDLFKPFATIGAAMAASATGDTVRVRAGTYSITSTINFDNEGNLHLEEGVVVNCNVANAPVFTLSVGQSKVISGGGQFNILGSTTTFWQQSGGTTSDQLCSIECYSILTISNSARIFDVSTGVLVVEAGTVYAMTSTIAYCAGTSSNINYRVPFTYCARMVDMPTNDSFAQFSCVCQTIQCFGTICFRVVGGNLGIDYETLGDFGGNCTFFSFEYGNSVVSNITTIRGGRAITYSSNPCISFTTTTGTNKLLRLYGDPFFYTGSGTNSITATSARTVLSSSASSNKTFNLNVTIVGNYLVNAGLVY